MNLKSVAAKIKNFPILAKRAKFGPNFGSLRQNLRNLTMSPFFQLPQASSFANVKSLASKIKHWQILDQMGQILDQKDKILEI